MFIISCNQDCKIVILLTQKEPSDADITPFPGLHFPVFPIPAVPLWFLRESPLSPISVSSLTSSRSQMVTGLQIWTCGMFLPWFLLLHPLHCLPLVTTSLLGWLAGLTSHWHTVPVSTPASPSDACSSPSSLMGKDGILDS